MTTITHVRYSVGKHLGTDDATVNHAVFADGTPCTPERPDENWAAGVASALYSKAKAPKRLTMRDADTGVETVTEQALR